ncbi:hypothetical protein ABBQ38_007106 [Trebouxia sp. C0009 RCD-2024]
MKIAQEHVSAGCNRVVGALDWGDRLVAYAAHNLVCLYDAEAAKVVATMIGHTDRVNCVQWLPTAGVDAGISSVIASGAADNCIIIWLSHADKPNRPWTIAAKLQGHSGAVVALAHVLVGDTLLLFSSAEDTQVLVWECSLGPQQQGTDSAYNQWTLRQKLDTGNELQHCLAVAEIPGQEGWLLLAMGGVDCSIRLALAPPDGSFLAVCSLSGHADWVRSLAFTQPPDPPAATQQGHLLLASASQDKYLRVWRIQPQSAPQPAPQSAPQSTHQEPPSTSAPNSTSSNGNLANDIARYAPKPQFSTPQGQYTAFLEALLVGHEDWVHSVQWQSSLGQGPGQGLQAQPLCLLSTSMDRTMMLWRPDPLTGLWMSEESVGDAGANNLGYFTGCFSPQGTSILAHGFTGALHLWKRPEGHTGVGWEPGHALGGHYGAVVDMCWGVDGSCLLTASTDQTCRITAQIQGRWSELARPQVHGHDMSCLAYIPASSCYVSGAEEKVLRVFQAPQAFTQTLAMAHGDPPPRPQASTPHTSQIPALGAAVAALGLSNKAVYAEDMHDSNGGVASGMEGGNYTDGPDLAPNAAPAAVAGPPLEEHLAQSSLWPEVAKLYGHGAELFCVAASPSGDLLASACKAQTSSTAAIWLWDTTTWAALGSLTAHSLTVTQLQFSPDGRWLLSVSRDRTVAVYQRGTGSVPFTLQHRFKAHARIIWGVAWSPDSAFFATASRDGSARLWSCSKLTNNAKPSAIIALGQPVTAIAFEARRSSECTGSKPGSHQYTLALGLELGTVSVYTVSREDDGFLTSCDWESPADCSHCAPVRRICWHSADSECQDSCQNQACFATCADDHCIRIFKVIS